ncbi:F-box protein At5g65850-like [Aegilops tauschii subsp. strangulata]|uniref:F-box protein At5g65850-like n=1 Tax=Aegilops tauschii subsp. strangulata TaxID=200361 RepID=UPI00098A5D5D|nr:F-box protein At5g65850-like [Aegilops tauschii subsp. strangulata]
MSGQRAPSLESADIIREILLKLSTRDVTRCRCVCRLWCNVVADPIFGRLHAEAEVADHVPAPPEALLVMESREHGRSDEASFFCVSSSKTTPMPRRVAIPSGYSLSNVCNGLLCFALDSISDAPAFISNPVTGETATLAKAPPFRIWERDPKSIITSPWGGGAGRWLEWRQGSCIFGSSLARTLPPVLVDGKLYLVTEGRPSGILVVDVATEKHRIYPLPVRVNLEHDPLDLLVKAFEMSGRLCLAVKVPGFPPTLQLWVMSLPPQDQWADSDDNKLCWDLHYSFTAYTNNKCIVHRSRTLRLRELLFPAHFDLANTVSCAGPWPLVR